jgi:thioesterase DpgC
VREALRLARLTFLRSYAGIVYAELTGDFERGLRVDELCYAAADRYPGLVPTRAAVLAERRHAQMDKDAGVELDQGIFLSKVFDHGAPAPT